MNILRELRKVKKRSIPLRVFLVLVFGSFLIINTLAWYNVSKNIKPANLGATVIPWDVEYYITSSETPVEETVSFNIDEIYPGMTTYSRSIRASNHGDSPAQLSYEVMSVTLFGTTFTTGPTITSEALARKFAVEYPFSIVISLSTNIIPVGDHNESYNITVSWPYESGDDDTDTYWGNYAYDYHQQNPNDPSISMQIKIIATQINE